MSMSEVLNKAIPCLYVIYATPRGVEVWCHFICLDISQMLFVRSTFLPLYFLR
jgi:hypothetical protein